MSSGKNGVDGNTGNNVYFGYVYDFFNNTEFKVDNLARLAATSGGDYYTGVWGAGPDEDYVYQGEMYPYDENGVSDSSNMFSALSDAIIEVANRKMTYDEFFARSYGLGNSESVDYVKVDMTRNGWNRSSGAKWTNSVAIGSSLTLRSVFPYPYQDASVHYDGANLKPGNHIVRDTDGFSLFTLTDDSGTYTYGETADSEYYDSSYYKSFDDNGQYSYNNPSIGKIIRDFEEISEMTPGIGRPVDGSVNFIKYAVNVTDTIPVPDTLKSEIKAGDILYFYTNKERFEANKTIEYMVMITEDLEECSYDRLMAAAQNGVTEPFTFKWAQDIVSGGNRYVYCISQAVSGFYKDSAKNSTQYIKSYGMNLVKLLSYNSNAAASFGTISKDAASPADSSVYNDIMYLQSGGTATAPAVKKFVIDTEHGESGSTMDRIVVSQKSGTTVSKIPLKVSNMLIRNGNNGNVESYDSATPGIIYLDSDGYAFTVNSDCYNPASETVTISYDDVFNEIIDDFSDYECGVKIITYSTQGADSSALGCIESGMKTRNIVFDSHENMSFSLPKTFGDYTAHNIVFWVRKEGSVTYMSRDAVAKYNINESEYDFSVYDGSTPDDSSTGSLYDPTQYVLSGISADKNDDCTLEIILPSGSTDVTFYMNSQEIRSGSTYSNSWCSFSGRIVSSGSSHTIHFSVGSNLPNIGEVKNTAAEYNAYPGETMQNGGCRLFNMLLEGDVPETSPRSVVFSVMYKTEEGTSVSSYNKVIQPGYTDNRLMPKVSLDMDNTLIGLEKSNRSSNGVLCNQFQFFVDVNVSDFTREAWGSYLDEDNILLDIDIKNTPKDYEFIDKYTIQNAEDMYTMHINTNDTSTADFNSSNYVRIKTYLVSNDVYSPEDATMSELDAASTVRSGFSVSDTMTMKGTSVVPVVEDTNGFIWLGTTEKQCMTTDTRGSGLNDEIQISMHGIKFSDLSGGKKFRFRVVVEYGNPLFSRLFFRFYVSSMQVRYGTNRFIVGGLETSSTTGTLSTKKFMFATETLNAFVCPVSMTAVPRATLDAKSTIPVTLGYGKYIPKDLDTDITRAERNRRYVNQDMDWFDFMTLNRFFQDNVSSFSVSPISLETMSGVVSSKSPFVIKSGRNSLYSEKDLLGYLALWYNTSGMTSMSRDMEVLEWPVASGNELNALRYSQYTNNAPIFTKQQLVSQVRDVRHENSVNFWNSVYQDTDETADGLFGGVLSTYGNGYMFLSSEYADTDTGTRDIYSLGDTMSLGDADVLAKYSDYDTTSFNEPDEYRAAQPQDGKWYQSLLWIAAWQWPKYYTDSSSHTPLIDAYDIVPSGWYLNNSSMRVPYDMTYSIYPRCAYDYERNNVVVFMLRCPSVLDENNYEMRYNVIEPAHPYSKPSQTGLNIAL